MRRSRTLVGPVVALLSAVVMAGCTTPAESPARAPAGVESPAVSAPPLTPAPSPTASASRSASASPVASDVLRVKVISQLRDPVDPLACASADASAGSRAGTAVTVTDGDGSVLGTQPLRVPVQGEAYGPEGHTFEGWDDLEEVDGAKVTFACFYVAEFAGIPAAETYVISLDGATDVETTPAQLAESEGWILQIIE